LNERCNAFRRSRIDAWQLRDLVGRVVSLLPLLRKEMASNGARWLVLVLVLGAIAAVACADHLVVSISLVYLYVLPLGIAAIFLPREISYSLIAVCILVHDHYSPRKIHPEMRMFDNLCALLCFSFVVCVIQRYVGQREALATFRRKYSAS
jgi:hypothetical protein